MKQGIDMYELFGRKLYPYPPIPTEQNQKQTTPQIAPSPSPPLSPACSLEDGGGRRGKAGCATALCLGPPHRKPKHKLLGQRGGSERLASQKQSSFYIKGALVRNNGIATRYAASPHAALRFMTTVTEARQGLGRRGWCCPVPVTYLCS